MSNEAELMKNLSANEKRRLMRHVDQGSPKKTTNKSVSPAAPRNYNPSPKPFGSSASAGHVNTSRPKSTILNRWNHNADKQPVVKPAKAPKPSGDVFIPKLNQDHVKLFTAKEAANSPKLQEALKKPAAAQTRVTPKPVANDVSSSPKPHNKITTPQLNAVKSSPFKQKSSAVAQNKASVKETTRSSAAKKESTPVAKPTTPSAVARVKASNGNSTKWSPPTAPQVSKPSSAKSPSNPKPTSPWQQRAGPPLSNEKTSSPTSPPTAVVAPMQERPQASRAPEKSKSPVSKSAEAGRQRAISMPVAPQQPLRDVVSYRSSSDDVILPEIKVDGAPAVAQVKPRSLSESKQPEKVAERKEDAKPTKVGHNFQPHELKEWVNWCDACGSVILSLFGKCVTCTKCRMVCHGKCALTVSLTCEADQQQVRSLTLNDPVSLNLYKTIVEETKDEATLKEYNTIQRVISVEEVQEKIEEFNVTVKGSQQMTLQEDGSTFRGFIRVTMNLTRPVSVLDAAKTTRNVKKSSFYIDKGAVKALHLTSDTTAAEVVEALLRKYSINDNPMKFALFEKQVREERHVILRKMLPKERPLFLRLLWGNGSNEKKAFILQENESRDIHWESFSVGELQMFIKILDKEENDYITDIKRKYKQRAQDVKRAIEDKQKKGAA